MKLTSTHQRQLSNLFALRDEAAQEEFIHEEFVEYWERLREEHGLAALLLLVEEFVRTR